MSELERLHVKLVPRAAEALAALVDREGLTRTEVVNRSVQVYAFLLEQLAAGGALTVRHADGTSEVVRFF